MIKLDKWQQDIVDYDGNIVLCTGRQVGKTMTFAYKSVKYMLKHPGSRILIVSLTEDQAKLIINMILTILETHHKSKIMKGREKPTMNKITLTNKSIALARPVGITGDAVRGFTGDVLIVDEAAKMNEFVFTSAKPALASMGGQIWMSSTPHGRKGYFYQAFQNKHKRWKVWYTTTPQVYAERPISTSWTKKRKEEALEFLEEEKKDMSQLQYGQEYLGLFLEDLKQYFPDELIKKCCVLDKPNVMPTVNNFMGVDIARMGKDETVYSILHKYTDTNIQQTENIIKTKQYTTVTERDIISLTHNMHVNKVGIDAGSGSLGVGIFDRLIENPITKRKVIAMNNRQISLDREGKAKQRIFKEDMYDNMLAMMERGDIKFLKNDEIALSLTSVQIEHSSEGRVTKTRIFGTYTHIAEALVRAAWLAQKEKILKFQIHYI